MALIPPDVGIRLRTPNDALQPVARVPELPGDLPDLQVGQRVTARIQEVLPENTYKALIAGKSVTLSLPESVKAGDLLELVVVDRTPRSIIAQFAEQSAGAPAAQPYQYSTISRAAQFIATLLTPEGETPPSVALNRNQPLLTQAPQTAAELAPALSKAVIESGLFYESHQAQWVAGKLPLAALLNEPQGAHSAAALVAAQTEKGAAATARADPSQQAATRPTSNLPVAESSGATRLDSAGDTARQAQALSLPDDLRPLVQQQLDAAATQRLIWHGEVWPGQTMEWQIARDPPDNAVDTEADERWATTLRLSTPRLGTVEASLRLSAGGVRITLVAPSDVSVSDLRNAAPALGQTLADAGIPLHGITVQHGSE
jgi:hypothetical protein